MTTKDVVEGLLYVCPKAAVPLWVANVISDERFWGAVEHKELTFMRYFLDPRFLIIVESQIHVYIIGDPVAKNAYNIINIEGFHVDHFVISKQQLREEIKSAVSEPRFLPDAYVKRIIFMHDQDLYVFNRFDDKKLLSKTQWTIGTDIYDANAKGYSISINDLFREIEDEFKKYGE